MIYVDVVARARGLAAHLLTHGELDRMARQPDLAALGDVLRAGGFPVAEGTRDPAALELAVRRHAARALTTLARWCGPRRDALAVIFEDEDRRSIRALVRGAAQAAPPEARLAGLVPTPRLPERALVELARQRTPGAIAMLLSGWGHPFGAALADVTAAHVPDLARLDIVVNRAFAARAVDGARRAGRPGALTDYVRATIDIENAVTAIALAGAKDIVPKEFFLPDGAAVTIAAFETAALRSDQRGAAASLAAAFAGTPFAELLGAPPSGAVPWEDELARAHVLALRRASRLDPLGPSAALEFALRLRLEVQDVGRTIWGLALGAPPGLITSALAL